MEHKQHSVKEATISEHAEHPSHVMPDGTHMEGGQHTGHDHTKMISDFLRRFWICLVLTIPVVVISPMFQMAVGYHFDFPGRDWVSVALGSIIYFYGGRPFLMGLWGELRRRQPGMMTLIGVAITVV